MISYGAMTWIWTNFSPNSSRRCPICSGVRTEFHQDDVLIARQSKLVPDAIADPSSVGVDVQFLAELDQLGTFVFGARIDQERPRGNPVRSKPSYQLVRQDRFAGRNGAGDPNDVPHIASSPD